MCSCLQMGCLCRHLLSRVCSCGGKGQRGSIAVPRHSFDIQRGSWPPQLPVQSQGVLLLVCLSFGGAAVVPRKVPRVLNTIRV